MSDAGVAGQGAPFLLGRRHNVTQSQPSARETDGEPLIGTRVNSLAAESAHLDPVSVSQVRRNRSDHIGWHQARRITGVLRRLMRDGRPPSDERGHPGADRENVGVPGSRAFWVMSGCRRASLLTAAHDPCIAVGAGRARAHD